MVELTPAAIARSVEVTIRRAIELVRASRFEVNLTDLLRCKRLWFYENVSRVSRESRNELEHRRVNLQMAIGSLIHELIELEDCIKELEMRVCRGDVCIVAKPDFWCPRERVVIELKTVARLVNIPRLNHLAQIKTYMLLLGAEKGILVYISRTTGEVKTFEVANNLDWSALDALFERAGDYRRVAIEGRAPEPEPGIWCRNCPYRSLCGARVESAELDKTSLVELLEKLAGKALNTESS